MAARLPIVHDLLGRLYTDAEWEALCDGCGQCCYESLWTDTGWLHTENPCAHLNAENRCRVYAHRLEAEKDCVRVTPSVVLSGQMPSTCAYVIELQKHVEEDYEEMPERPKARRGRSGERTGRRRRGRR